MISIHHPPVNALSHPVRVALLDAIEQLDGDTSIRAIIIHGEGRVFIAGADIREFTQKLRSPLTADILLRLEACRKPVIAVLHGATLGGGAELALAAHFRIAARDLQFGFPEIKLGLLPGAGGTVRLPRVVGIKTALKMIERGELLSADEALTLQIVDRIVDDEPRAAAITYARALLSSDASISRVRDRPIPDIAKAMESISAYRAALPQESTRVPAHERIMQALEATVTLSFDAALSCARGLFEECRSSNESAALRHVFLAERAAGSYSGTPKRVQRVGVVGAGTMGSGIALAFARSGFDVLLYDAHAAGLEAGVARIHALLESQVNRKRLDPEEALMIRSRVTGADELKGLANVDLVIEAVFEDLMVKQQLMVRLGQLCSPSTILASNTSTLDIHLLAHAAGRPPNTLGMHFFSPAHVMRLIELVRTPETSPDTLATALSVSKRIGKLGVVVGNAFGFVGNRMLYAYGREKEMLLLEGATPERIDRVLENFGMAMGPNAVGDLAGLDIGATARRQWKDRPSDPRYYRVTDLLVEQGRLGQKMGLGFYRYEDDQRQRQADPDVVSLIRAEARCLAVKQRDIVDDEIVERCMMSLVNEGARILEARLAASAADIDVIWCNGYGFPRWRGGPMFYADTIGLPQVLQAIRNYHQNDPQGYWTPSPLLERLATEGRRLADWVVEDQQP